MSASAHTPPARLRLIVSTDIQDLASDEALSVPRSPRLENFLRDAAAAGLEATAAIRLGIERALVLREGQLFNLDVESVRRRLRAAASGSRPCQALPPSEAAYVRELSARRPVALGEISDPLSVELPAALLTRARGVVAEASLHAGAVEEMIAWEIAARLEGRSMSEWALKTLSTSRSRARPWAA